MVLSLYSASLAAFASSFVFLAQASSAKSDQKELLDGPGGGCTSIERCAMVQDAKGDQRAALDRWGLSLGIGGALAVAATATLLIWQFPNTSSSARLAPAAGPEGGRLVLEGRF